MIWTFLYFYIMICNVWGVTSNCNSTDITYFVKSVSHQMKQTDFQVQISEHLSEVEIISVVPKLCCNFLNITVPLLIFKANNCGIEELEESCFSQKIQMVEGVLDLHENKIEMIKKGTFQNLKVAIIILDFNE